MNRVFVVGGPGSGKLTLAATVAARHGLPLHELDQIAYDPPAGQPDAPFHRRTRTPDPVRRERAAALAAADRRPLASAEQLVARDGANSTRTLAAFLAPAQAKVVRCRGTADGG